VRRGRGEEAAPDPPAAWIFLRRRVGKRRRHYSRALKPSSTILLVQKAIPAIPVDFLIVFDFFLIFAFFM
jgi:hypothetical protein